MNQLKPSAGEEPASGVRRRGRRAEQRVIAGAVPRQRAPAAQRHPRAACRPHAPMHTHVTARTCARCVACALSATQTAGGRLPSPPRRSTTAAPLPQRRARARGAGRGRRRPCGHATQAVSGAGSVPGRGVHVCVSPGGRRGAARAGLGGVARGRHSPGCETAARPRARHTRTAAAMRGQCAYARNTILPYTVLHARTNRLPPRLARDQGTGGTMRAIHGYSC